MSVRHNKFDQQLRVLQIIYELKNLEPKGLQLLTRLITDSDALAQVFKEQGGYAILCCLLKAYSSKTAIAADCLQVHTPPPLYVFCYPASVVVPTAPASWRRLLFALGGTLVQ